MKVLVCGGRDFNNYKLLEDTLNKWLIPSSTDIIISGLARGADTLGVQYANAHNIQVMSFPALWNTYGKSAGYRRNEQMLIEGKPDLVIAFQGGKGTQHMIDISKSANITVKQIE